MEQVWPLPVHLQPKSKEKREHPTDCDIKQSAPLSNMVKKAFTDYLNEYISIDACVEEWRKFVKFEFKPENYHDLEDLQDFLEDTWYAVVDLPCGTKIYNDQLILLLRKLTESPPARPDMMTINGKRVFTDLPLFGQFVRNMYYKVDEYHVIFLNTFVSKLTQATCDSENKETNFALQGLWALRNAFEGPDVLAYKLDSGLTWFVHCHEYLHALSQANKEYFGDDGKPGSLCKDKQWRGFTPDRWAIWQQKVKASLTEDVEEREPELYTKAKRLLE